MNAADVRPATEIAAYRLFSKNICVEVEEQMNPGLPTGVVAVPPPIPPHGVEPTNRALVGGQHARIGVKKENGDSAERSSIAPAPGKPSTTAVERYSTGHRPDHASERGSSPNCSMGSTFMTAVQRPDVETDHKKELLSRRENSSTAPHCAPDDCPARARTQLAIAQGENSRVDGRGAEDVSTAQHLNAGGRREDENAKSQDAFGRSNKAGSETATEGETSHVGVEGGTRRGQERLWDGGRAPSDSFDKQRVTLTSAR